MDRSRLLTALALAFTLVAVILGVVNIGLGRGSSPFVSPSESFLSAGRAGIALIEIQGVIRDGDGPGGADRIVRQLDDAAESPAVRAVLLTINSPGGSVGATKKIYDRVIALRKTRPVVATITDVAASGGYYIASAADKSFAYSGSLVGSIGVIAVRPNVGPFLRNHGIEVDTIKSGRYKDSSYPFRAMTDEERQMMQRAMDDAYDQFIVDVAEGRRQSQATVRSWAEGRIYSGTQARAEQMIDDLGGRERAMQAIREALKIEEDLPLMTPRKDFWDDFWQNSPMTGRQEKWQGLLQSPMLYLYPAGPGVATEWIVEIMRSGR